MNADLIATISVPKPDRRVLSFNVEHIEVKHVTPYSEIYGIHPKLIVATSDGWRRVPIGANPYTGCCEHVGVKRIAPLMATARRVLIDSERRNAINAIHWYGAAYEKPISIDEFLDQYTPVELEKL